MLSLLRSCLLTLLLVGLPASAGAVLVSSSASDLLRATFLYDFDIGAEVGVVPGADVIWAQISATEREMRIWNSTGLLSLGATNYDALSESTLSGLAYSSSPIPGGDAVNRLNVGDVFAVRTTDGNFSKVQVLGLDAGFGMTLRFATFDGAVPVPSISGAGFVTVCVLLIGVGLRSAATQSIRPATPIAIFGEDSDL